jgi:hypothetical protein
MFLILIFFFRWRLLDGEIMIVKASGAVASEKNLKLEVAMMEGKQSRGLVAAMVVVDRGWKANESVMVVGDSEFVTVQRGD